MRQCWEFSCLECDGCFGGTFHPERCDTFVALLEQSFGVIAERRGDTTILRPRAAR